MRVSSYMNRVYLFPEWDVRVSHAAVGTAAGIFVVNDIVITHLLFDESDSPLILRSSASGRMATRHVDMAGSICRGDDVSISVNLTSNVYPDVQLPV